MDRIRFFLLCMPLAAAGHAAVYQWTDNAGTVQFSDRPPREAVTVIERHDIDTAPAASSAVAPSVQSGTRDRPPVAKTTRSSKPRRATHAAAGDTREQVRRRCANRQHTIARIESQLRAGYSARRGIALSERLHAVRDAYYHECR